MFKKIYSFCTMAWYVFLPNHSFAFQSRASSVKEIDEATETGWNIMLAVSSVAITGAFLIGAWQIFQPSGEGMTRLFFRIAGGCTCLAVGFFAAPKMFNFCI